MITKKQKKKKLKKEKNKVAIDFIFYIIPTKTNIIKRITPGTPNMPTKRQVIIFIGKYIKPVKLINHKITSPTIAFKIKPSNFLPLK